ncbi:hypothetical protein D3C80_1951700 [compost metagenome]
MRVIGRCVSGSFEVVTKDAETLAYLDGGAQQQGLFKQGGIGTVIMGLGDGLLQQCQRILVAGSYQAITQLAQGCLQGIGVK